MATKSTPVTPALDRWDSVQSHPESLPGLKAGDSFLLRPGMLVGQSYSPSTGVSRLRVSLGDGCCFYCEQTAQLGFRKTETRAYTRDTGEQARHRLISPS